MSRKHLFAIVVLLGAAAVAGLLALTRTTTAATQASSTQIAAKSRSLDKLEASLRRSLAQQPPALPAARSTGASSAPRTVFVPSSAAAQAATGRDDDDGDANVYERRYEDEHEDEDEGADD
jgi:hypothetical protein